MNGHMILALICVICCGGALYFENETKKNNTIDISEYIELQTETLKLRKSFIFLLENHAEVTEEQWEMLIKVFKKDSLK